MIGMLFHVVDAFKLGLLPTIRALLHEPSLILRPRAISHIFMTNVWAVMGAGIDENSRAVKEALLPANARGVVLDIGAGEQQQSEAG